MVSYRERRYAVPSRRLNPVEQLQLGQGVSEMPPMGPLGQHQLAGDRRLVRPTVTSPVIFRWRRVSGLAASIA